MDIMCSYLDFIKIILCYISVRIFQDSSRIFWWCYFCIGLFIVLIHFSPPRLLLRSPRYSSIEVRALYPAQLMTPLEWRPRSCACRGNRQLRIPLQLGKWHISTNSNTLYIHFRSSNARLTFRSIFLLFTFNYLSWACLWWKLEKKKKTCSVVYTHRFALIQADVIGVTHIQKAAPPFLALFQILKQTSREDGLVLQRFLWWEQTFLMDANQNHFTRWKTKKKQHNEWCLEDQGETLLTV